ncbi:hypothetical protein [Tomitella gaofuii]|uniref:hypothetical protein n=1 Tax=Tomitella gaofuii TaxID=2760083 RepID=UPI0015FD540A|nr:hypothetical protein [Tomitella gaofuii]
MTATILVVVAALVIIVSWAAIYRSRGTVTSAGGQVVTTPELEFSWYASFVPYAAGVIAALIAWLVVPDLDTWGIYGHPSIFAVATTFVSLAFVRERISKPVQTVVWSVMVAACSAATIVTW